MPMVQTIAMDSIVLPEQLMRTDTIMQDLGALIEDIAQNGLINPISVRNLQNGQYRLVAGHRRYLAHKEMGRSFIQANIYELGEGDDDLIMGSENFARTDVNPVEEARFYAAQIAKHGIAISEVARRYKRSVSHVHTSLSLLVGDERVLEALKLGSISKAQAYEINKIQDDLGKQTALHYAQNNGMTAVAIKAYREGRERVGADVGSARVVEVITANAEARSRTQLLCTFCKQFRELTETMVMQGCHYCMSELTKAGQLYNYWEGLKQEGFDCTCAVCVYLPAPEVRPALG